MTTKVTTNNVPRDVIDAWQLTAEERKQFDYLDWAGIEDGTSGASFFRYRGELYDLGEFTTTSPGPWNHGLPDWMSAWDGYQSDSFFSGIVIRYADDACESVVVGTYYG